jgi:hypothetical protein
VFFAQKWINGPLLGDGFELCHPRLADEIKQALADCL